MDRLDGDVRLSPTPNKQFLMDGNGKTTIFHAIIWSYPLETTVKT